MSENVTEVAITMSGTIINTGVYCLIIGLCLLAISFFLKSIIIYMAIIGCMVGVLVEPEFLDTWIHIVAVLIMALCGIGMFNLFNERGYE